MARVMIEKIVGLGEMEYTVEMARCMHRGVLMRRCQVGLSTVYCTNHIYGTIIWVPYHTGSYLVI